jgi:HAD superfamily hydrolase (TIGR01509 family)
VGIALNEKALGKRLQFARKKAGLTQQELCQKAGLSYSTLAKIERGAIKSPSVFTVASIASVTATTIEELLGTQSVGQAAPLAKKRSKTGVSFIYLDVNGVLVRFFHRAFSNIAQQAGIGADVVETLFWRHNDAVCRGDISIDDFNGIFARELNMVGFDWKSYYMANIDPMPGVEELAGWVSENYKVGLMTNNMPGFTQELISSGRIPQLNYDVIIDSSEVRAIKPEEQIYRVAIERAGVPANEILLIDDGRTNLMAADRLGWHVLWFDDYQPSESIERARQALAF